MFFANFRTLFPRGERFHDAAKFGVVARLEGVMRTGLVWERNKLRAMLRATMRELG